MIINDNNFRQFINPVVDGERKLCSSFGMLKPSSEWASGLKRFSGQLDLPMIAENEWDDRIAQRERDKSTLEDLALGFDMEVLDQNGTNYCWANGVAFALMLANLQSTGVARRFSPASVAAPIRSFRNQGGWGEEALDYMIKNGINLQEDWPPNAIDRSYFTEDNREKAKRNIPLEFFRCDTWAEVVSAILNNCAVAVGYNWWGHLVCGVRLAQRTYNLRIANSWKYTWGENGYGWLEGRKKFPDGTAVAIVTSMAA